ncbi:MAG: hypothetical protein ACTHMD_02400, partial [Flavisolibacter sp.]
NTGYLISLREVGDLISEQIFNEIVNIYKEYEPWFSKHENPPVFDNEAKEYDQKQCQRIDDLQKKWFFNENIREKLFQEYFLKFKNHIVQREN